MTDHSVERFFHSLDETKKPNGAGTYQRRFPLTRFADIKSDGRRRDIVKDLIPRAGLIVVWGPPKCGKSFWVSDLALHVALGRPYRERRVEAGVVVYVTCEGQSGFPARIEAFRRRKLQGDEPDPPFYLLSTRLDLVGDIDTLIAEIADQLCEVGIPILIVIDTLNRSLVGSESKDEDMSAYIQTCDRIRETFNCAVLIIHHCGTEATRPRGHTSLTGAADAQIAVKRDGAGNIIATLEYMKDGPEGDEIVSRLAVVDDIGADEDGDPITSCVVEPGEADPAAKAGKANARPQLSNKNQIALDALRRAIAAHGEPAPSHNYIPPKATVVSIDLWRRFYLAATNTSDGTSEDTRRKAWRRSLEALQARKIIDSRDALVWEI